MKEVVGHALTPRDISNTKRYVGFCLVWALAYVASTYLLKGGHLEAPAVRWLAAILPSVLAAFAGAAYWRYLNETDELLRAIELRALALAMAAGYVVWPALWLIEEGLGLRIELPVVPLVMTAVYVVAVLKGRMAYL